MEHNLNLAAVAQTSQSPKRVAIVLTPDQISAIAGGMTVPTGGRATTTGRMPPPVKLAF